MSAFCPPPTGELSSGQRLGEEAGVRGCVSTRLVWAATWSRWP